VFFVELSIESDDTDERRCGGRGARVDAPEMLDRWYCSKCCFFAGDVAKGELADRVWASPSLSEGRRAL